MSLYGVPQFPAEPRKPLVIVELVKGEGLLMFARSEDGRVFRSYGDADAFHEVAFNELAR